MSYALRSACGLILVLFFQEAALALETASSNALPAKVVTFMERRDMCDHFRGEDADDADRKAQINAKAIEYCTGTDKALQQLRRKYTNDPEVIFALSSYEDNIE